MCLAFFAMPGQLTLSHFLGLSVSIGGSPDVSGPYVNTGSHEGQLLYEREAPHYEIFYDPWGMVWNIGPDRFSPVTIMFISSTPSLYGPYLPLPPTAGNPVVSVGV